MAARDLGDQRMSHGVAILREKCEVIAGRAGIIAAILLFIVSYGYSVLEYGILPTIALAWLPCSVISWLTAIMVASVGAPLTRRVITTWRQLSLLVRLLVSA